MIHRHTREGRRIALIAVATLTVFATMSIAPALPAMARAFPDTPDSALLVKLGLTLPAIAIALCAPVAGWVVDRYGRLPILYASMALFGLAGAAGYFLDSLYAILVSRLVLGVAIAGSMTSVQTLAGDYFHGEDRVRFAGLQSAIMSIGAMIIVGAAGWLADQNWRAPFLLYLHAWLLIPLVAWLLDEPPRGARHAIEDAEAKTRRGELVTAYLFAWFGAVMFYMIAAQLPFLLSVRGMESGMRVGVAVGVVQFFAAAGSTVHIRVKAGRGFLGVHAVAFVLIGAGYGLIAAFDGYATVLVGAMVAGLGVGLFFPNCGLWVLAISPPALRGRSVGGLSAAINLGQFSSPLVLHSAVASAGIGGAFGVAAGVLFAGAAGAAILGANRRAGGRRAY